MQNQTKLQKRTINYRQSFISPHPDSIVDDVQDPTTSHINLVQMNKGIIDRHKNWNILLLKVPLNLMYKLPHKLLNNLKLRTLGNKEILAKSQNSVWVSKNLFSSKNDKFTSVATLTK